MTNRVDRRESGPLGDVRKLRHGPVAEPSPNRVWIDRPTHPSYVFVARVGDAIGKSYGIGSAIDGFDRTNESHAGPRVR